MRIKWVYKSFAAACLFGLAWPALAASSDNGIGCDPLVKESTVMRAATEKMRREAGLKPLVDAQIQCGPWYAIGPFKDAEYGVFGREFDTAFAPEKDVIARGEQLAELDKIYQSVPVAGAADSARRWAAHTAWADGYYHQLPSGPPPGRNEVLYLYRTITCAVPVEVTAWLVTLDAAKAWLDGKPILHAPIREGAGQRFLQASFKIPLRAGENRLLLKIVKCFQTNGFSFAIDGLHPVHPLLKGPPVADDAGGFDVTHQPYASANWQQAANGNEPVPAWYVKRDTWQETLLASRQALAAAVSAKERGGLPFKSPVLRQKDGPQHVRLNVSGLQRLVLVCTIGGDDYGYDDTIWTDPKLVAKDGTETWLTDLKPAKADVGFMKLFVNQNYAGQQLKIGGQEFERGFWAHAPSEMIFELDGKYEWFDTSFGLDALAVRIGSSEFLIAESVESAGAAASAANRDARLRALLVRDFPGREVRQELERELVGPVKQLDESLTKLRRFRFEVEPLPTFDPPVLTMQRALDHLEPTPGGTAYLTRLAAVREQARAALASYETGLPGAAESVLCAAESLDRFREDSIRNVGPIVFVRHPSFGRINAVDPYDTGGRGPASIAVFDPARPDQPPRVIYADPDPNASIWQASLSYDARTVFFAARRPGVTGSWHSANTLSDHTPAVMDDGRVMFTRWDYGVDKGVFQRHGVWAMNPDGSRLQFFFGNTVLDPNAFWQCVPVPGRPEVVATFGGHHAGPYGVVGLLWNRLGIEAPRGAGFRFLTPECPTYFDGNFWNGYMDPQPLNEHEFLVSYGGDGGERNRLYLLDSRGNKTCLWEEAGELGCYSPLALRPRKRPPVIPMTAPPDEFAYVDPVVAGICPNDSIQGTFALVDVYAGLQGRVHRGEVKALQIMELVPKTRPHTGGYAWNISPLIGRGTFYVRRLIGTVPVEDDGSAHFTAPALRDISFNALDADGRMLQKMGSTTQVTSGEKQSCIGCHEHRSVAPVPAAHIPLAARRAASTPARPDWGAGGIIDYCLVVQPVWDKHCVKCHAGPRPDGQLDLSGDKTRYFNMSYDMLIDRGLVHHVPQNGADQDLTTPQGNGSLASRLVTGKYLEPDHYGVTLSPDDRQRVYTWIDANVPYYHTYLYTDGGVNGARDRWYDELPDGWFQKEFAPVFKRRCYECHQRTVEISDAWLGQRTVTVTSKVWSDITIMDQGLGIENSVATFGPEYRINLTHPEWSQMLMVPLAKESGGLGFCKDSSGKPIFQDIADPDYRVMLGALEKGRRMLELNPRVDLLPRPDPTHPETYAPSLQRPRVMP